MWTEFLPARIAQRLCKTTRTIQGSKEAEQDYCRIYFDDLAITPLWLTHIQLKRYT
jgi:hypothetical protein